MKWYEDPAYIKMCEKAEKIQKEWKPISGDVIQHIGTGDILIIDNADRVKDEGRITICGHISLIYVVKDAGIVWLPRQDRLQEMVKEEDLSKLLERFWYFIRDCGYVWLSDEKYNSMEQLWLAFVMSEKYDKIWNGEEWIKKGGNR